MAKPRLSLPATLYIKDDVYGTFPQKGNRIFHRVMPLPEVLDPAQALKMEHLGEMPDKFTFRFLDGRTALDFTVSAVGEYREIPFLPLVHGHSVSPHIPDLCDEYESLVQRIKDFGRCYPTGEQFNDHIAVVTINRPGSQLPSTEFFMMPKNALKAFDERSVGPRNYPFDFVKLFPYFMERRYDPPSLSRTDRLSFSDFK